MRLVAPCLMVLLSALAVPPALGWQEGVDEDQPLQCDGLPLAGADRLVVRVRPMDGSFGLPVLVGLKGNDTLWIRNFPKAENVNTAKFLVSCEGRAIHLSFQFPADNAWVNQHFSWNGRTIRWLRRTVSRP